MTTDVKEIFASSFQGIMSEFQELVQQGWEIDTNNPPDFLGFSYRATLIKNDRRAAQMAERILEGKPIMTRGEILEKARASRAAKKLAAEANPVN